MTTPPATQPPDTGGPHAGPPDDQQADARRQRTFSWTDPAAIAAAKALGPVAPFYVEQESPTPPGGLPQPGKLVVSLPDNHLQYALTWYGLALVLLISYLTWAFGSGRDQPDRSRGVRPLAGS